MKSLQFHARGFSAYTEQNLVIQNISTKKKKEIDALVKEYGLTDGIQYSALPRRNSMSISFLPTCGLAIADLNITFQRCWISSTRCWQSYGLQDKEIVIRMTGYPRISLSLDNAGRSAFIGDRAEQMYQHVFGQQPYPVTGWIELAVRRTSGKQRFWNHCSQLSPNMRRTAGGRTLRRFCYSSRLCRQKFCRGRIFIRKPLVYQITT